MILRLPRVMVMVAAFALGVGCVAAEQPKTPPIPVFKWTEVLPAAAQAAQKAGIAMNGMGAPAERTTLRPGDTVTALVTLTEGEEYKQWIVRFQAAELTEKERQLPPVRGVRVYTSTGREFQYDGERAVLALRVLGPFKSSSAATATRGVKDVQARVRVNSAFLGLGFDQACAALIRKQEAEVRHPDLKFYWGCGWKPYPPEKAAGKRKVAEVFGVTEKDERAMCGELPALWEFVGLASQTPGLQSIMQNVIHIPWWSIIANGGKMPAIGLMMLPRKHIKDAARWNLSETARIYALPFELQLNEKPALVCQLAVTAPRPPLLTSAGIVGIAAQSPDGKGPHLMIRLLSAQCAPEAVAEKPAPVTPTAVAVAK
ncbi:MAG: hypothetical protein HZA31_00360 [Opitutae bacterium]|nr:hypothetical protein [Opitutae bacterium]